MSAQARVTGKEAVMQAVVEAACELMAEKQPSQLSIREIAREAGVNHGLIHRHFGSKQNLISHVVAHIDTEMRETAGRDGDFQRAFTLATELATADARFWKIVARLILDGYGELLQTDQTSYLRDLRDLATKEYGSSETLGLSLDESLYMLIALGLGHEMFGDYISQSMGVEPPDTHVLLYKVLKLFAVE